jgi:hypothetical protein
MRFRTKFDAWFVAVPIIATTTLFVLAALRFLGLGPIPNRFGLFSCRW